MDRWEDWFTRIAPEDEVHNIDWIVVVLPSKDKDDSNPDPSIK